MTTKKKAAVTEPKTKRRNPVIAGLIEGLKQPPEQLAIRAESMLLAERLHAALLAGDYDRALPILEGLRKATAKWVRIKGNKKATEL
jgi:hypothetical protein